jgi:putative sterol carrier protein
VNERGILPGFREGMENVSKDEQRHIGFGVKMLSDLNRQDPDCKHAVADLLREVLPYTTAVLVPPNWDRSYTEVFGKTIEDIFEQGMISLEQKLRSAGMPLEDLPGPPPIPLDLTPRERANQAIALLQRGVLGEKTGPPQRNPETVAMLFDLIKRTIDTDASPPGGTSIQWDFKDADPWHVVIDNGSTRAEKGRLEAADLTLRCGFEDWVDVVAQRTDPRVAIATGKLRPKGSLRNLWRMRKLFGR